MNRDPATVLRQLLGDYFSDIHSLDRVDIEVEGFLDLLSEHGFEIRGRDPRQSAALAEVDAWRSGPDRGGDNGGWSDGFDAGREWAADRIRAVLAGMEMVI